MVIAPRRNRLQSFCTVGATHTGTASTRRLCPSSTSPRKADDLFKNMNTAASQAIPSWSSCRPIGISPHHGLCNHKADEIQEKTHQHYPDTEVTYTGAFRKEHDTAGYLQACNFEFGKGNIYLLVKVDMNKDSVEKSPIETHRRQKSDS
ncbi:unnamed protein product [Polarella glacialis]|uniref:Uncharacterized protein n=1 Tax=Polarella glacialis TaxID=89957 RepID=A0A813JC57_POLGL|nr:unnamed protein product [Polarella glacialis]